MRTLFKHLLAAAILTAPAAYGSLAIGLQAFNLRNDQNGTTAVAQGVLIQLVNLGNDGVFNPITLADDVSGLAQWVSGDDSLLNVSFIGTPNVVGDFTSTNAFDLAAQAVDPVNGDMDRIITLSASIPQGTKIGIRWFPGLLAADFATITLQMGQRYGEFTRQSNPLHGGSVWQLPIDPSGPVGNTVSFDSLAATDIGGLDATSARNANFTVIPEPAAIGLSLLGAAGLSMLRRRRA
jgi:hypothetical protein